MSNAPIGNGLALLSLLTEKVCLFEDLSTKEVAWLLRRAKKRALQAAEVLLSPSQSNDRMYVILSGQISVEAMRNNEREQFAVLGPGATVGEMSLMDSSPPSATAVSITSTTVLEFEADWLQGCPDSLGRKVYQNFSRILIQRLRTSNTLFESLNIWPRASGTLERKLVGQGLTGLNLTGIDATKARLSRADLSGVDLRGANLSGADLRGAIFDGTDLRQTDLTNAVSDQVKSAKNREYWERLQKSVQERATAATNSTSKKKS